MPTPGDPVDNPAANTTDPHATVAPDPPVETLTERPIVPGYEILGELGRGGMGVVYKARHLDLNRVVALKMVLSGEHASLQDRQRFRLEAESVAQLQHPNIVQIHDVGEAGGRPYLSLEFIDGISLADYLQKQRPTPEESARLIIALARAIHLAHCQGIVHRDLKPGNILLAKPGCEPAVRRAANPGPPLAECTPKISDFGLAKKLGDDSNLTRSHAIMGTPSYMAPEQAGKLRKEVGPAADIYALGAILYQCLTSRPPFYADTAIETIMQVTSEEPPPPHRWRPDVPRDLETICLKCLEKTPRNRYANAQELARDLQRWLDGEPILARPVGPVGRLLRWCSRHPALATTWIAVSVFYVNHLLMLLVFPVEGIGGFFHWFVTGLAVAWCLGAYFFEKLVHCPGWEERATFAWAGMDVVLFSLLLWQGQGPRSSLLSGYLLLIGAAALRFHIRLVWFVTLLCMMSYGVLEYLSMNYRQDAAVALYQAILFLWFLALMGLVCHLLLRRVRQAQR